VPAGCRFHPRCPLARPDPCAIHAPPLRPAGNGLLACWRAEDAAARDPWASTDAA
jgi:ABC-type dipeptide/oligopeptide/nickel transport system ATPase component